MKIGYSKKVTKNLGNYESLVVEINVEEDLQDGETADQLFYKLKDFVNAKIQEDLSPHISSKNQKNSTAEVKTSFDKTDAKSDDSDFIKHVLRNLCINKVQKDANNRSKINNLLSEFGVSKVLDLHNDDVSSFRSKLEAL